MGAETTTHKPTDPESAQESGYGGSVPVSALVFTVLTLLVEAAAQHLGTPVPTLGESKPLDAKCDLGEARLALDAANALLTAARTRLSNNERIAIEGLLTQLQVEYVKRVT